LLIWIRRYEKQIPNDEKKKEDSEKMLEERRREVEGLEGKLRKTRKPIWKDYYQQRIKTINEYIKAIDQMNTDLDKLIEKQKARLQRLKELYEDCADPQCREQVTEVPQTPKEPDPAPEQPKDTPVNSAPPPEEMPNPTPVVLTQPEPQPGPSSTPASGPCVDHHAELTNGERVFHRIYIQGEPRRTFILGSIEQTSWNSQLAKMQSALEGPGRQDPRSSTKTLRQPSWYALMDEFERLQARAQPCEEVTIVIKAHGFFDEMNGEWEGSVQLNGNGDPLTSGRLAKVVKGFRPDVSVTVFMDSCYGGGFGGKGGIQESQLVQVIGNSTKCTSLDMPGREELFEDFINGIDNAANGGRNGRSTAREVKSHMARSGWPIGSPLDH
jgi:hypothetical protein